MNLYERELLRLRVLLTEERRAARTDVLTGLGNRRSFEEARFKLVEARIPFSLILFDAANLHTANKILGHDGADTLLKRIAERIRENTDAVWRVGGDEFAVLLQRIEKDQAIVIRDRIEAAVGEYLLAPRVTMFLVGGVATFNGAGFSGKTFRKADKACEERKAQRKAFMNDVGSREEAEGQ